MEKHHEVLENRMKIAVYMSMFARNYQVIVPPIVHNESVDYVLFTDGPLLWPGPGGKEYDTPYPWQLCVKERQRKSTRVESRIYKFLPHVHLPEYDWTIYIDSNVRLHSDPVEIVEAVKDTGYDMMLLAHPWRDCLYDEIAFNREPVKQPEQRNSDAQVVRYKAEGFPEHNGLAACTFIVRNNRSPEIQRFGEFWWEEYVRAKNPRDQCCFEYCVWRTGVQYFHMNRKHYRWSSNEFFVIGQFHWKPPTVSITRPLLGED